MQCPKSSWCKKPADSCRLRSQVRTHAKTPRCANHLRIPTPLLFAAGCCTDLTKTGGAHIGAIAKFHNESSRLTVSSMVTQGILNKLCGSPMRTEPVSTAA